MLTTWFSVIRFTSVLFVDDYYLDAENRWLPVFWLSVSKLHQLSSTVAQTSRHVSLKRLVTQTYCTCYLIYSVKTCGRQTSGLQNDPRSWIVSGHAETRVSASFLLSHFLCKNATVAETTCRPNIRCQLSNVHTGDGLGLPVNWFFEKFSVSKLTEIKQKMAAKIAAWLKK